LIISCVFILLFKIGLDLFLLFWFVGIIFVYNLRITYTYAIICVLIDVLKRVIKKRVIIRSLTHSSLHGKLNKSPFIPICLCWIRVSVHTAGGSQSGGSTLPCPSHLWQGWIILTKCTRVVAACQFARPYSAVHPTSMLDDQMG